MRALIILFVAVLVGRLGAAVKPDHILQDPQARVFQAIVDEKLQRDRAGAASNPDPRVRASRRTLRLPSFGAKACEGSELIRVRENTRRDTVGLARRVGRQQDSVLPTILSC